MDVCFMIIYALSMAFCGAYVVGEFVDIDKDVMKMYDRPISPALLPGIAGFSVFPIINTFIVFVILVVHFNNPKKK